MDGTCAPFRSICPTCHMKLSASICSLTRDLLLVRPDSYTCSFSISCSSSKCCTVPGIRIVQVETNQFPLMPWRRASSERESLSCFRVLTLIRSCMIILIRWKSIVYKYTTSVFAQRVLVGSRFEENGLLTYFVHFRHFLHPD